jgi:signal recognition particle GTPase
MSGCQFDQGCESQGCTHSPATCPRANHVGPRVVLDIETRDPADLQFAGYAAAARKEFPNVEIVDAAGRTTLYDVMAAQDEIERRIEADEDVSIKDGVVTGKPTDKSFR